MTIAAAVDLYQCPVLAAVASFILELEWLAKGYVSMNTAWCGITKAIYAGLSEISVFFGGLLPPSLSLP